MAKTWLDKLLESAESEVDEVISDAIDKDDAQGIEDVNKASTDVKDADVSDDPDKLTYDDDCYSQTTPVGDETVAGTVDIDIDDTDTSIANGNETKAATEAQITADDLRNFYTEAVAEVINESKEEINAKYKAKIAAAKEWKAAALAREKAKEKKEKEKAKKAAKAAPTEESVTDFNSLLNDILG